MTLQDAIQLIDRGKSIFEQAGVLEYLRQEQEAAIGKLTIEQIISIEEQTRLAVSTKCHDDAYFDRWRALPPQHQLLIYERLQAARAFLALFEHAELAGPRCPIQIAPGTDRPKLLAFLLIDYWALAGRQLWLARLHDLHNR